MQYLHPGSKHPIQSTEFKKDKIQKNICNWFCLILMMVGHENKGFINLLQSTLCFLLFWCFEFGAQTWTQYLQDKANTETVMTLAATTDTTDQQQRQAGQTKVDTKTQKISTKTSTIFGQNVEKEVVGQIVVTATEIGDTANQSLQTEAVRKVALRNAKIAGVIKLYSIKQK